MCERERRMGPRTRAGAAIALLLFALRSVVCVAAAAAAPPPLDCSAPLNSLSPCLTFVQGNGTKPPKTCCNALGSVQSSKPVCLCQLLQQVGGSGAGQGVNVTVAMELPKLCGVPVDTSKCPALLGQAPTPSPSSPLSVTPAPTPLLSSPPAVAHSPKPAPSTTAPPVQAPTVSSSSPPPVVQVQAPAPAAPAQVDCTNQFNTLSPCLTFLESNDTNPPKNCCSALGSVQSAQPVCLCQLLQDFGGSSSVQGINVSRAFELPTKCNVPADTSKCPALLGQAPTPSPASPAPIAHAPAPVLSSPPRIAQAPAPAAAGQVDCTNQFNTLAPCLTFVEGSGGRPPKACCDGLGSVQSAQPVCLCQLLQDIGNSSTVQGVNVTLALELPKLCNVPADTSKCPALLGGAPATSPSSPAPGKAPVPASSSTPIGQGPAVASGPGAAQVPPGSANGASGSPASSPSAGSIDRPSDLWFWGTLVLVALGFFDRYCGYL